MSTELAEFIRLPSTAVSPTGTAMPTICRPRPGSGGPGGRVSRARALARSSISIPAENTSHTIIPSTISPTVRSAFWGRNTASSPSTAPVRTNCSASSTSAGGRT